jgi:hypothetical protein
MTVPNSTQETPTKESAAISALPPKRARRRTTRGSHSWRFRRPPSRKRVEVATARGLPEGMLAPIQAPDLQPITDSRN